MQHPITVTLRKTGERIQVSRAEAANMRLLGLALTEKQETDAIRKRMSITDKARWQARKSGAIVQLDESTRIVVGPTVLQMSR